MGRTTRASWHVILGEADQEKKRAEHEHGRPTGTEYLCASGVVGKDSPNRPWCNVFVTGRQRTNVAFRHSANR
jgi:hypothetical protein